MLKLTTAILFIGISLNILSQEVTWMYGSGDWTDDSVNDNAIDLEGNAYFTGFLSGGTVIGDTTYQSRGAYVAKFDADGNYLWSHRFGDFNTYGTALTIDSQNNVYVIGGYKMLNYEGYNLSYAWSQTFVMKISSAGQVLWLKGFGPAGTSGNFIARHAAADQNDNLYITGGFDIDVTIDDQVFNVTGREGFDNDIIVLRLDENGDLVHGIQLGSTSSESIQDIKIANNHLFLLGFGTGAVIDVNGVAYERPYEVYSFIAKFDLQGVTQWVRPLENGNDYQFDIDSQNNFVFAFQPWNSTINGYVGLKVEKTDDNGNELFSRVFNQTRVDKIGLAVEDLDIYLTAGFESEQIDQVTLTTDEIDVAILKFNEVGYLQWVSTLAGSEIDDGISISVRDNTIYVSGEYNSDELTANDHIITNNSGNNDNDFFFAALIDTTVNICPPDDAFAFQYPQIACQEDSVLITLTNDYAISIDWFKDGMLLDNSGENEIKITEPGVYTARINSETSCAVAEKRLVVDNESQASNETDLILYTLPEVAITTSTQILKGEMVVFNTKYNESYDYEWYIQRITNPKNLTNSNEVAVQFNRTFVDLIASVKATHKVTGCYKSDTLIFDVDQILHTEKYSDLSLFPNPASDFFEIKTSQIVTQSIIKDLSGRIVKSSEASTVDVSDLPKGVFIVEVYFKDSIARLKLIKQ